MAKLLTAQATDQVGVTLPAGTEVTRVAEGEYVDRMGRLCWPATGEVTE